MTDEGRYKVSLEAGSKICQILIDLQNETGREVTYLHLIRDSRWASGNSRVSTIIGCVIEFSDRYDHTGAPIEDATKPKG